MPGIGPTNRACPPKRLDLPLLKAPKSGRSVAIDPKKTNRFSSNIKNYPLPIGYDTSADLPKGGRCLGDETFSRDTRRQVGILFSDNHFPPIPAKKPPSRQGPWSSYGPGCLIFGTLKPNSGRFPTDSWDEYGFWRTSTGNLPLAFALAVPHFLGIWGSGFVCGGGVCLHFCLGQPSRSGPRKALPGWPTLGQTNSTIHRQARHQDHSQSQRLLRSPRVVPR